MEEWDQGKEDEHLETDKSWTGGFHVLIATIASCREAVWAPACLSFIFSLQPLF